MGFLYLKRMAKKGSVKSAEEKLQCIPKNRIKLSSPPRGDYNRITNTVAEISKLNFDGNIVPHTWYTHIVKHYAKYDKPYLEAIIILSDICYWFRYTPIRDEVSGKITSYKKKFKYDKLQKSYNDYMELYGLSAKMTKSAIDFLVKEGYIYREFVNYKPNKSSYIANQMFIEPIAARIAEISFPKKEDFFVENPKLEGGTSQPCNVDDDKVGYTYTEITNTYTTNKDIRSLKDHEKPDLLSDPISDQSSKIALCAGEEAAPNTFGICLSPSLGKAERIQNIDSEKNDFCDVSTSDLQVASEMPYKEMAQKFEKYRKSSANKKQPKAYYEDAPFDISNPASMSEVENLRWLGKHRDYQLANGKYGYEREKPSICEFIFEAQMRDIPVEFAKRTYELWSDRNWKFQEQGNVIEHWVGLLRYSYKNRKSDAEVAKASKVTCSCGFKYIPPVLDQDMFDPEDLPKCICCSKTIEYILNDD